MYINTYTYIYIYKVKNILILYYFFCIILSCIFSVFSANLYDFAIVIVFNLQFLYLCGYKS